LDLKLTFLKLLQRFVRAKKEDFIAPETVTFLKKESKFRQTDSEERKIQGIFTFFAVRT